MHSFTPSLVHITFLVFVGLKAHCVFECVFCRLTIDVCQRNDRQWRIQRYWVEGGELRGHKGVGLGGAINFKVCKLICTCKR